MYKHQGVEFMALWKLKKLSRFTLNLDFNKLIVLDQFWMELSSRSYHWNKAHCWRKSSPWRR